MTDFRKRIGRPIRQVFLLFEFRPRAVQLIPQCFELFTQIDPLRVLLLFLPGKHFFLRKCRICFPVDLDFFLLRLRHFHFKATLFRLFCAKGLQLFLGFLEELVP